eukprot:scaffold88942_cov26-Phaeocystis_antarctica.AAC.1
MGRQGQGWARVGPGLGQGARVGPGLGQGWARARLEQTTRILRRVGRHHLEARAVGVPGGEALRVLGADARRRAVRAAEDDGHLDLRA